MACLGGLAAFMPACSSSSESQDSTSEGALVGAPIDTSHTWSVGVCSGPLTGGSSAHDGLCLQEKTRCTGTLVAKNLVLTARHCLRKIDFGAGAGFCDGTFTDDPLSDAPVHVTTSDSVKVGTPEWIVGTKLIFPRGRNSCDDDVAFIILERDVLASHAQPIKIASTRNVAAQPPREVAVVGRGVTSELLDLTTFEPTYEDGDLRRRIATHIPFDCATDASGGCEVVDYSSPPTNKFTAPPGYFVIGAATASGDSGAGVIDQAEFDSAPRVLGVNSAGTYGPDGKPNHGLIVRMDRHPGLVTLAYLKAAAASLGLDVVPADDSSPD